MEKKLNQITETSFSFQEGIPKLSKSSTVKKIAQFNRTQRPVLRGDYQVAKKGELPRITPAEEVQALQLKVSASTGNLN